MTPEFARKLRHDQTDVERKLWNTLRNRQLRKLKFRRQQPIGPCIVDFVCFDAKYIVELDGDQHAQPDARRYDDARTAYLESSGYRVKRLWNVELRENFDGVMDTLYHELEESGF